MLYRTNAIAFYSEQDGVQPTTGEDGSYIITASQ